MVLPWGCESIDNQSLLSSTGGRKSKLFSLKINLIDFPHIRIGGFFHDVLSVLAIPLGAGRD
jgi:hypothetical protein